MAKGKSENTFLDNFKKEMSKKENIATQNPPPTYWIDSGNYVLNKILSDRYDRGFAQGRLALLAGSSGAGKSLFACQAGASAQKQGYGVLVVDTEGALDDEFLEKAGIDVNDKWFSYVGLSTIPECADAISKFIKSYKGTEDIPPFMIILDSLDALSTDSDNKKFEERGELSGDQGQHAKQSKDMLMKFMHAVKGTNLSMICTKQVYQNQDPIDAKANPWKLTEALKYPFSQLAIISKLNLKDKTTNKHIGYKAKIRSDKTRFSKPFQEVKVEVPYSQGVQPYSGVLEAAETCGVIGKNVGWYTIGEKKFQEKNYREDDELKEEILKALIEYDSENSDVPLQVELDENEEEEFVSEEGEKAKRQRVMEERAQKEAEEDDDE